VSTIDVVNVCAGCVTAAFAAAGLAIAVFASSQVALRDTRRLLAEVHRDLTTGEVAAARNVIGTLLHSRAESDATRLDVIDAYFRLIWGVQRALNALRVHSRRRPNLDTRASNAAGSFWSWNFEELVAEIGTVHWRFSDEFDIQDADAWHELVVAVGAHDKRLAEDWLEPGIEARRALRAEERRDVPADGGA
jgi:hypothetical protein